ncbi:AAA family ATPase [Legionella jordanis]|uniref:DamX-related protein n=1 Tax=Legionella jordanis TaxID=456 RepID=A0A0W0V8J4_9GAMM|nr:AAA family ATPase [Legionella jordanis]KTD16416.1 DamX-related protein [Legionella jordanis]RMX04382.1 hypothetical protein EAW55_02795 [Legionella jordanis]RMX15573.1 hypothetical protein EAS68_11990 [Legionella jordanis]VEH12124.1 DamX-like protein [Legionella jordanis]HAT8714979.1 AAA family ATPase [Legionella jordanis]
MQNMAQEMNLSITIPPAKDIFKPASWLNKIDFINHSVLFNNVLITVLAETGGGKSTFIELLMSGLDSQIKAHVIKIKPPFSQENFLNELAGIFHLRTETMATPRSLVQQINERKAHTLIVVDDAHHLSDEFLQNILMEISQQEQPYFHLCLVSDFSIVAALNKLEGTALANLIQTLEPGALTEAETKSYLLSNLPAPRRLDQSMSDKRLEQFYQITGGNIARINKEMTAYFCQEPQKSLGRGSTRAPKYVGVAASFAVVMLASLYVWQNQDLFKKQNVLTEKESAGMSEPELSSTIPAIQIERHPVLSSEIPGLSLKNTTEAKREDSYIPPFNLSAVIQAVQPPPLKRVVDIILDEEDKDNNSLVVMDKVVVIPKPSRRGSIDENPQGRLERKVISSRELPKTIHQGPSIAQISAVALNAATQQKITGKSGYTVQLLASQKIEDLKRFINQHHLDNTSIRMVRRGDNSWYILTLGEYARMDQAQTVAKNLPHFLTQFKPWIRSTAGLTNVG